MIKKLFPAVRGYEKQTVGASLMIIIEGVLEILIPYLMTKLIKQGIEVENPNLSAILTYGGLMILMAIFALLAGALSVKSTSAGISLADTGLTGLTRDNGTNAAFTGSFNGNSKTISLAVGEPYGLAADGTTPVSAASPNGA